MTLTAVLFAGGESRRMGADKATNVVAGETLWVRQLGLLRELKPERIFISARTKPVWCPAEIAIILDEPPSGGPLSGLSSALKNLWTTHLRALAVDLPQMTTEHLRKLWSLAQPSGGVIPQSGKFFEPLCAIYPVEAVAVAASALAVRVFSLHSLARNLLEDNRSRIYPVSESERQFYHNGNSPEDLK